MPICSKCGFANAKTEMRCPECGGFYSKAVELIDQAAAEEAAQTFGGRCRRILASGQIRQALLAEWQALSGRAKFSLFVIFVFVFALVASVL